MMGKKYQIYMTCWDVGLGQNNPYEDEGIGLYDTYAEAEAMLLRDVICEANELNAPTDPPNENTGHFIIGLDDEDYVAIIRLWENINEIVEGDNDYWNVTGYNIREVEV